MTHAVTRPVTSDHRPRRHHRVAAAVVLAVVSAGAAAGCGVPLDDEPRAITRTTLVPVEPTPTTVPSPDGQEVSVYFLRDDQLERQGYPVADEPTLRQALTFVLEPPAEGLDPGLRTAVPPGTTLRSVEVDGEVASVDLTSGLNALTGPAQKEAFAQIVFTALAFDEVQQVRFLVDGTPIDAPTDDGNLPVIGAENYDKPLNPR